MNRDWREYLCLQSSLWSCIYFIWDRKDKIKKISGASPLWLVIESPASRKHADLLNDIALALTTEAEGDTTTVTMTQSAASLEFLYFKNAPCNQHLKILHSDRAKEKCATNLGT